MEEKKRVRFVPSGLKVREATATEGAEESRVVEGCAIVFNRETCLYDGAWGKESEIILPSCVTPDFLREQDIKLNLLHERGASLARWKKGEGSLKIEVREDGVYFECELPKCDLGDRALALIKNGTYTGCSFEFYAKDYKITNRSKQGEPEDLLITHEAFERITALTIAMDPAYEDTSVAVREDWEGLSKNEERLKQEEDDAREARHVLGERVREIGRECAILEAATE
jgi:hypothetical protein